MASKPSSDLNIAHLFLAGAVTAAGAGFFMWVKSWVTRRRRPADAAIGDDDLDTLLAAEAATED